MEFEVKPEKLTDVASELRSVRRSLNGLSEDLRVCGNSLDSCLSSTASASINRTINGVRSRLECTASRTAAMGDKLDAIRVVYLNTENTITGKISGSGPQKPHLPGAFNPGANHWNIDPGFLAFLKMFVRNAFTIENVKDFSSFLSKLMSKLRGKSFLTLAGSSIAYGSDLWDLLYTTATGQVSWSTVYNLGKDGAGLWTGMYKCLDKNLLARAGLKTGTILGDKFGNTIGIVSLLSSFAGCAKETGEALAGRYNSWMEGVGAWFDAGEKGVDVAKNAYNLGHMEKGVLSASAKGKGGWFTLGETVIATFGQAFTSYGKYNQDGTVTAMEGAEIGVDSSVRGLTTLARGVTFGIIDIDSDKVAGALKGFATDCGTSVGNTIAQNPEMAYKFKNGNFFESMYAFGWGVTTSFKNKFFK